jgi:hypothetical protein
VSEEKALPRLSIVWSLDARADLRAIDRETALSVTGVRHRREAYR